MPPDEPVAPKVDVVAPAVVVEPAAPVVVEAPKSEPVVVAEAPKVEAEPKAVVAADEPSLLEQAGKKDPEAPGEKKAEDAPVAEAKPGDKPAEKPAEAKPGEEVKPVEVSAEPVVYTEFQLPEGVTLKAEELGKATAILSQYRVPQEAAQALVTQHTEALKNFATHMAQEQQNVFAETRKGWRNEVKADALIGGSGHNTAMAAIARMRDLFVPEAEMAAFNQFCRITGAGDHPVFNKLLFRLAQRFDEPSPAPIPNNPTPNAGKKGGGRQKLYDHPTSVARRNAN